MYYNTFGVLQISKSLLIGKAVYIRYSAIMYTFN
nr:MAG TPA: hypothetical protein [Caudoviricetes sp.]